MTSSNAIAVALVESESPSACATAKHGIAAAQRETRYVRHVAIKKNNPIGYAETTGYEALRKAIIPISSREEC